MGQRSSSGSDEHANIVNSIDREPIDGFLNEHLQILTTLHGSVVV